METATKMVSGQRGLPDWNQQELEGGIDISWLVGAIVSGLKRRKAVIILGSLLFSGIVYLISLLVPKQYVTSSFVSMVRSRPKMEIVELEKLGDPGTSRDQSFLGLAVSGDIISEVLLRLRGEGIDLVKLKMTPDSLVKSLTPVLMGDMVGLSVRWQDPIVAAKVANRWAEVFIEKVNQVYSINFTPENRTGISEDYSRALGSFREANGAWAAFLKNDNTQEMTSEINEKLKLRELLLDLRQNRVAERVKAAKKALSLAYEQRFRLGQCLEEARSLTDQIKSEKTVSAGSRLSLIALKAKVFASEEVGLSEKGSGQVRLDFSLPSSVGQSGFDSDLTEAQEISRVIEGRLRAVNERISSIEKSGPNELKLIDLSKDAETDRMVSGLDAEINGLREKLAQKGFKKEEIENQQKIAANTFQSASSRMQLLSIFSDQKGNEVRLSSQAYPPAKPVSPRPLFNAALSFVLGFVLLSGWSIAREIFTR